jgi:tetratricopeptide (TPR) repeat protein
MKKLMIILSLLLITSGIKAQLTTLEDLVEQANQAYSSADYATAITQYESVLSSGYESAGLYFNLGNAYFKSDDIPAAILNYEKARKLDPTDENIRFNLDLANSRIVDKMEPLPQFFLRVWWKAARDVFPSDYWAKIVVICFILALISAVLFIISRAVFIRKISFWAGLVFIFFMSLSLLFGLSGYYEYTRHSSGIIFTPTITVKSSPNDNSVDLFVMHEGTKVFITDLVEGWSEVRLANGNVGWVRTDTYRPI